MKYKNIMKANEGIIQSLISPPVFESNLKGNSLAFYYLFMKKIV